MVVPHPVVQLLNPVTVAPDCCAAVQVNVLPLTVELSATPVAVPPQIVFGEAEPTGIGFTVTISVVVFPTQVFATGVMVYVAVPDALLLLLLNV